VCRLISRARLAGRCRAVRWFRERGIRPVGLSRPGKGGSAHPRRPSPARRRGTKGFGSGSGGSVRWRSSQPCWIMHMAEPLAMLQVGQHAIDQWETGSGAGSRSRTLCTPYPEQVECLLVGQVVAADEHPDRGSKVAVGAQGPVRRVRRGLWRAWRLTPRRCAWPAADPSRWLPR
jgi:hypothetical protein